MYKLKTLYKQTTTNNKLSHIVILSLQYLMEKMICENKKIKTFLCCGKRFDYFEFPSHTTIKRAHAH